MQAREGVNSPLFVLQGFIKELQSVIYKLTMWDKAQEFEASWWGDCSNTLGEEIKQLEYARLMGLKIISRSGKIMIDTDGLSIIDIGGGPVSMLLKTTSDRYKLVVDPTIYPQWVYDRYDSTNIDYLKIKAEETDITQIFDECWMYNCLQHTESPRKIIENIKTFSRKLRIFEWIEVPKDEGHIHTLHKSELDYWLGKEGQTKQMNANGCYGLAYFNIVDYEKI